LSTARLAYTRRYQPLKVTDPEDDNWKTQAACRDAFDTLGFDPWFPASRFDAEFGKRICEGCPVREACYQYSIDNREMYGTWGGVSEWERDKILGRRVRR